MRLISAGVTLILLVSLALFLMGMAASIVQAKPATATCTKTVLNDQNPVPKIPVLKIH